MSTSEHPRRLLTVVEVAERLNVSRSTVRRRIDHGEIPALRLGRGPQAPVRIDPLELAAWLYEDPAAALSRPTGEAA
jgi:excisionase family DNA binding protein